MLEGNHRALARRFPQVLAWIERAALAREIIELPGARSRTLRVDGIQLESACDPAGEAVLQAELVPPRSARATLFGLAQGSLARALCGRRALRELRIAILAPQAAREVLARFDLSDLLADRRVELVTPHGIRELEPPFAVAPAELALAVEEAWRVRDLVSLELATPYLRQASRARDELVEERIAANRSLIRVDGDVAELFGTRKGARIFVAGAGPSLVEHARRLSARSSEEPLIAVDAALRSLIACGVRPEVVVSMDMDEAALVALLAVEAGVAAETTLVYDPVVARAALEGFPGRRLAAYGEGERHGLLRREIPRGTLWSSGSVLHAAADLAAKMGAAEIVLVGADFATPGGQSHVEGFAWKKQLADRGGRGRFVLNGKGERVASLANLIGYLRDLERYIARHPEIRFVNGSRSGARIEGSHYEDEGAHRAVS